MLAESRCILRRCDATRRQPAVAGTTNTRQPTAAAGAAAHHRRADQVQTLRDLPCLRDLLCGPLAGPPVERLSKVASLSRCHMHIHACIVCELPPSVRSPIVMRSKTESAPNRCRSRSSLPGPACKSCISALPYVKPSMNELQARAPHRLLHRRDWVWPMAEEEVHILLRTSHCNQADILAVAEDIFDADQQLACTCGKRASSCLIKPLERRLCALNDVLPAQSFVIWSCRARERT